MKKVMIGLLILIPILILLIVAAVTNFISTSAIIAVDNIAVYEKGTTVNATSLQLEFPKNTAEKTSVYDLSDYIDIVIFPERANEYTIDWRISGDVTCMDDDYEQRYEAYKNGASSVEVLPPVMLVDTNGNQTDSSTTGRFQINSFCRFEMTVQVAHISRTLSIIAVGYDVISATVVDSSGSNSGTVEVGESIRLGAKYHPMSSIVSATRWHSDNESVATVDANGTVTARGVGEANITMEANKHSNENEFVTSEVYRISVRSSVGKFGKNLTTSKTTFTLEEIGVNAGDVTGTEGCTISGNTVTVTAEQGSAKILLGNDALTINICDENAIAIANASVYDAQNGYVFEVSGLTLKLSAVWADMLKGGTPDNVAWTISDESIAKIENGEVSAVSSGLVMITATRGGSSTSLYLNVQEKVVSMQLATTNASLAVGIARETVFAAEKYIDAEVSNAKEANSVLIHIIGAPVYDESKYVSELAYDVALAVFYGAYNFEIVEGSEYASFDDAVANRLIFNPTALEGKGKQTIKVRVTAKYPKYESVLKYVTGEVDIKAVYGVEVSNMVELRQASADQEAYAYLEGNLKDSKLLFGDVEAEKGFPYRMYTSKSSERCYAICFAKNTDLNAADTSTVIEYEFSPRGLPIDMGEGDTVKLHGDVYGNNGLLSAEKQQLSKDAALFRIMWSNVTVSNLTLRANTIDSSGNLDASDTDGFSGKCFDVYNGESHYNFHLENIRVEYCIVENARQAIGSFSSDLTLDGVIVRNVSTVSMYVPLRVSDYWDNVEQEWVTGISFTHLNLNNCVYSNCLQSVGSFSYERVTLTDSKELRFVNKREGETDVEAELRNAQFFIENFAEKGINTTVRQTGFIDIYNWHNCKNSALIQIDGSGAEVVNVIIARASEKILTTNSLLKDVRYWSESEQAFYFHMGFICTGISMGQAIMDERTFLDLSCEDEKMNVDGLCTMDMNAESSDSETNTYEKILQGFSITFYNYKNTSTLTPHSTYTLDYNLIRHLHGEE